MSELQNGDFELNGYRVGDRDSVFVSGFEPGTPELANQDFTNPLTDGVFFGRDTLGSAAWTLEFAATGPQRFQAITALASEWRKPSRTPGSESVLRFRVGNRTRRVYGRPRQFLSTPGPGFVNGVMTATANFTTSDHLIYGDVEQTMSATLIPSSRGGVKSPLVGSLTSLSKGAGNNTLDVTGDAPAPFTATIYGPVSTPVIEGDGWRIEISGTLAFDQSVTIDTRRFTVLTERGVSISGRLHRTSRLANARLAPGARNVTFSGIDATGRARCDISWHPAFYSI